MDKKKFKHSLATDPPPCVDSPPIRVREIPAAWENAVILSEKQWRKLSDWVTENWELVQSEGPETTLEVALISRGRFEKWQGFKKLGLGQDAMGVKGHLFWSAGWTACPMGPSLLCQETIKEAIRFSRSRMVD